MLQFWFLRRKAKPLIARPSIEDALFRAGSLVVMLSLAHILAMVVFEGMPAFDGLWLTLTTLVTVGYGDLAAKTFEGRVATIVLLYLGGIYTLANFASQWFEWRADARDRKWRGLWRWRMKEHLLVLNSPADNATAYFERLLRQLRGTPRFRDCPVLIVTRAFGAGLPDSLAQLGVAHCGAWGLDFDALQDCHAGKALAIAILAKSEADPASDSVILDAIQRVRSLAPGVHLVAECLDDRNRERMFNAGASAVVRPTRVYPEIMARALAYPGAEKVLEEILDAGGAECTRLEVHWSGAWKDAVDRLVAAGVGTAIAYEATDGKVRVNPPFGEPVQARALFALVNGEPGAAQARAVVALR